MNLILLVAFAAAVAYVVGRPWAVAIPLVMGCIIAATLIALGLPLYDTPLPFTVGVATIGAAFGVLIRRRPTPV